MITDGVTQSINDDLGSATDGKFLHINCVVIHSSHQGRIQPAILWRVSISTNWYSSLITASLL